MYVRICTSSTYQPKEEEEEEENKDDGHIHISLPHRPTISLQIHLVFNFNLISLSILSVDDLIIHEEYVSNNNRQRNEYPNKGQLNNLYQKESKKKI